MSAIDKSLDYVVEGYDIDGVLTKQEVREQMLERSEMRRVDTIIVTSRSDMRLNGFLEKYPDIARASSEEFNHISKIVGLREARDWKPDADKHLYFGSWIRDRLAANMTGWEYKQL